MILISKFLADEKFVSYLKNRHFSASYSNSLLQSSKNPLIPIFFGLYGDYKYLLGTAKWRGLVGSANILANTNEMLLNTNTGVKYMAALKVNDFSS